MTDEEEFDPVADAYNEMVHNMARQLREAKRWQRDYEPGDEIVKPEHFVEAWEKLRQEDIVAVCEAWERKHEKARQQRLEEFAEAARQQKAERKRASQERAKARGITTKQALIDQALEEQRKAGMI